MLLTNDQPTNMRTTLIKKNAFVFTLKACFLGLFSDQVQILEKERTIKRTTKLVCSPIYSCSSLRLNNFKSAWTIVFLGLFNLMLMVPLRATAQQDMCDRTVNYTGGHEDWVIPEGISEITFTAKGGDGGYGRIATYVCTFWDDYFVNDCKGNGGQGATVVATFSVGIGEGQIPQGAIIRTVVGGAGQSRNDNICGGTSYEFGGGGGGTGVLYQAIGSEDWELLLVAGAGGGDQQLCFLAFVQVRYLAVVVGV